MSISSAAFSTASNGSDKGTYTPSVNPNIGTKYETNYDGVVLTQAIGGETYSVERYGKRIGWTIKYTFLRTADRDKLQLLIDQADGKKNTFYFSEDNFSTSTQVRFDQDSFSFDEVAQEAYSISFKMIQYITV
jgi:hypothetical protein